MAIVYKLIINTSTITISDYLQNKNPNHLPIKFGTNGKLSPNVDHTDIEVFTLNSVLPKEESSNRMLT